MSPLNDSRGDHGDGNISRNVSEVQEKPTNLVEVIKHFPKDVFEKRPFRDYMGALQVYIRTFIIC